MTKVFWFFFQKRTTCFLSKGLADMQQNRQYHLAQRPTERMDGKILGMRVVGTTGGEEKGRCLTSTLGFDEAVDYRAPDSGIGLKAATPNGVDVNFETRVAERA